MIQDVRDIGPKLKSYWERVRARPRVAEAMTAEGLIKKPAA